MNVRECKSILVQFNVLGRLVSSWLPAPEAKPKAKSQPGIQFVSPTVDCSLRELPADLKNAGFVLADATRAEVGGGKVKTSFVFLRKEDAAEESSPAALKILDLGTKQFEKLCGEALWRACAYDNPIPGEGARMVSVNADSRHVCSAKGETLRIVDSVIDTVPA